MDRKILKGNRRKEQDRLDINYLRCHWLREQRFYSQLLKFKLPLHEDPLCLCRNNQTSTDFKEKVRHALFINFKVLYKKFLRGFRLSHPWRPYKWSPSICLLRLLGGKGTLRWPWLGGTRRSGQAAVSRLFPHLLKAPSSGHFSVRRRPSPPALPDLACPSFQISGWEHQWNIGSVWLLLLLKINELIHILNANEIDSHIHAILCS